MIKITSVGLVSLLAIAGGDYTHIALLSIVPMLYVLFLTFTSFDLS